MSKLDPYEQWMVRSNLKTVLAGGNIDRQVALIKANGYPEIADALLEEYQKLSKKIGE